MNVKKNLRSIVLSLSCATVLGGIEVNKVVAQEPVKIEDSIDYSKLARKSMDKSVTYLKEKYAQKESGPAIYDPMQTINSYEHPLTNVTAMNNNIVVLVREEETERKINESVVVFLKRLSGVQNKGLAYEALKKGSPELEEVLSSSEQEMTNGLERSFEEKRFKYVTEKHTRKVPQNHCPGHKRKTWYGKVKKWWHDGGCETRWIDEYYDAQIKKNYTAHVKMVVSQEVRKGAMIMDDGKAFEYIAIIEEYKLTDDGEVEKDKLTRKLANAVLQEDGSATFTYVKILNLNEIPED